MLKALLMVFDELHDRADSLEVLDFAVGNFNLELILNAHDQIDNGEGVRIQIIDEIGILVDDCRVDAELIRKNFNDFLQNQFIFLLYTIVQVPPTCRMDKMPQA